MFLFLLACVSVVDMPMNEPKPRSSSISAPMVIPVEAVDQSILMMEDGLGVLFPVWVECYGAGDEVEFTLLEPVYGLLFGDERPIQECYGQDTIYGSGQTLCPDNYTKSLSQQLEEGYAHVWVFLDAVPFVPSFPYDGDVQFSPVDLRVHYGDATAFVTIDVSSAGAVL